MIVSAIADSKNQIANNTKKSLKLEFIGHKDVFIEADKGRINQVISNLLNNAIKFETNEGTVSIVAVVVPKNNEIVVNISDTGVGMDSEILPRLFTKFAAKSITGTGLGLFISKSIIDSHSGKIWGKIIILKARGLRLDLAYLCIIRDLKKYSNITYNSKTIRQLSGTAYIDELAAFSIP